MLDRVSSGQYSEVAVTDSPIRGSEFFGSTVIRISGENQDSITLTKWRSLPNHADGKGPRRIKYGYGFRREPG